MGILAKKQLIRSASYILPDIINSFEEYQKLNNLDLRELDTFSLWQEQYKVKAALAHIDPYQQSWLFVEPGRFIPAIEWLKARYKAIKRELRNRRGVEQW